jgi:hypothetical protein
MPCDRYVAARFTIPVDSEREGVDGYSALALRYLTQGLPGFRGNLSEWSYQRMVQHETLWRLWWPRFVGEIIYAHGRSQLGRIIWIDDPADWRESIIKAACEAFILQMPSEAE